MSVIYGVGDYQSRRVRQVLVDDTCSIPGRAACNPRNGMIYVRFGELSESDMELSVLFEKYNLEQSEHFLNLQTSAESGLIDRKSYVLHTEYAEFESLLSTQEFALERLAKHGDSELLKVPNTFPEFMLLQISKGHAGRVANQYDALSETETHEKVFIVESMSAKERKVAYTYANAKGHILDSKLQEVASQLFEKYSDTIQTATSDLQKPGDL